MSSLSEVARLRAAGVGAPADRPSQRRCASDKGSPAVARAGLQLVQVRAKSDSQEAGFTGFATITEASYEMWDWYGPYTEIVSAEAPAIALASDPDVNFVLNHGGVPFGRTKSGTLTLTAEPVPDGEHAGKIGLKVDSSLDLRMPSAQDVFYALERGDLDEMSFKFSITRGQWSPDYTEYRIDEFDLNRGDVSVVNYGANPNTLAALRNDLDPSKMSVENLKACAQELAARAPAKPAMTRKRMALLAES